jgi:presequence protease
MDPFEPLKYERPLQQLKARIAAEGSKAVFSPLIEKFILKNAHCVTVEMQVSRKLVTSVMVAFSL